MFWKKKEVANPIQWYALNELSQLEDIVKESNEQAVLIYKHSTRCGISSMALDRLERTWDHESGKKIKAYYLDLLAFREVSNAVAEKFAVYHQSPQVILIKEGKAVFDDSHMAISYDGFEKYA